jgi:DNA excision repair protein ERCC-1
MCWWWWWVSHNSADEAGQYLTAYKQSEHRQPTLIRERVDKTPSALLRTALTTIPHVNKTDVETLRASFGVRTLSYPLVYIHIPYWNGTHTHTQNFAKIAQADAAQFARLPGFGPKKVARLKDAFERPFRTRTTSALAAPSTSAAAAAATPSASTNPPLPAPDPTSTERPAQSPLWDIELDLNSPSPPPLSELTLARDTTPGAGPSKRAREESPQWDIERGAPLALDDEDLGAPGLGLEEDADVDMDIAPALRAKRRRA